LNGRTRPGPRTAPRPYALPPLRFPVETVDGSVVYIVKSELVGGKKVLTAEDGRRLTPSGTALRVIELEDEDE
jgi:hypothetical protein